MLLGVLIVLAPTPVAAQIFTGTVLAPRQASEVGVATSETRAFGTAVEAMVRRRFAGFDLGLRVGATDVRDPRLTFAGEYRNAVLRGYLPVDLAITAAGQAIAGDIRAAGASLGMSIGHTVVPGNFSLTPFVHPRLAVVDVAGLEASAELLGEVGAEIEFAGRLAIYGVFALDAISARWGLGASLR